jgi:hypothetical protein
LKHKESNPLLSESSLVLSLLLLVWATGCGSDSTKMNDTDSDAVATDSETEVPTTDSETEVPTTDSEQVSTDSETEAPVDSETEADESDPNPPEGDSDTESDNLDSDSTLIDSDTEVLTTDSDDRPTDSDEEPPTDSDEELPTDSGEEPPTDSDEEVPTDSGEAQPTDSDEEVPTDSDAPFSTDDWSGLVPNIAPADQEIDLFGVAGHRFWAEVSNEQVNKMNQEAGFGGYLPAPVAKFYWGGDIYTPDGSGSAMYIDHLVVEDKVSGSIADYGKVQAKTVGQSTARAWTANSIPNMKVDMDEFQDHLRLGGEEHFRLNNALVGSIFREQLAYRFYRLLGYPAARSTFAFFGNPVWGDDVWVPMVLSEVYKGEFCRINQEILGGACESLWECYGDPGEGYVDASCKLKECATNRIGELYTRISQAPTGEGFAAALEDIIDWPLFHKFQCLSWMFWTGDDTLHNHNNTVIVERDDGRLVWLPYSVDISMGQEWYQNTPLYGDTAEARGCQQDSVCWADTVATCQTLIDEFVALKPEELLDETEAMLTDLGMMRDGDEQRAQFIRDWLVQRQIDLPGELEESSGLMGPNGCPVGQDRCNYDWECHTVEDCHELICPDPYDWCEAFNGCIDPAYDVCPNCTGDTPVWCQINETCVPDVDTCSAECDINYRYCPSYRQCLDNYNWCPDDYYDYMPKAVDNREALKRAAAPYSPQM